MCNEGHPHKRSDQAESSGRLHEPSGLRIAPSSRVELHFTELPARWRQRALFMITATVSLALFATLVLPGLWIAKTLITNYAYPIRVFTLAEPRRKSIPASCGVQMWLPEEK